MAKIFNIKRISDRPGYYVAGFVDGEGSFYLSVRKHCKQREENGTTVWKDGKKVFEYERPTGWRFSLNFNIANNDTRVLEFCRAQLCCGAIRESNPGKFILEITDQEILNNRIVPFFNKFQFESVKKRHEFRVFKLLLKFFGEGQVTTTPRMLQFLRLRTALGRYRGNKQTHTDADIVESFKPEIYE
jgi:hypothetical protein